LVAALLVARQLAARDSWTRERLLAHQASAFRAIVRHAARASPFYLNLYRGIGLDDDLPP
jgi:phenylacetate-CoA ligase